MKKPKARPQISLLDEIIVDNFAGGGGASTGIELATGRPVAIAINHDPAAIIQIRMLTPKELYAAMGFPPDYIIARDYTGRPYPKSQQVARCGNAVCPQMAAAVVRANLPEWAVELNTMDELNRVIAV